MLVNHIAPLIFFILFQPQQPTKTPLQIKKGKKQKAPVKWALFYCTKYLFIV